MTPLLFFCLCLLALKVVLAEKYEEPQLMIEFEDSGTQQKIDQMRTKILEPFGLKGDPSTFVQNSVLFNLTKDSLRPLVADSTFSWFLVLYAPWCPHCRHFLPRLNKLVMNIQASPALSRRYQSVVFATVDCEAQGYVADQFNAKTFPTILYMTGDKTYEYIGKGDKETIDDFIMGGY